MLLVHRPRCRDFDITVSGSVQPVFVDNIVVARFYKIYKHCLSSFLLNYSLFFGRPWYVPPVA